jgi:hypothetical protein
MTKRRTQRSLLTYCEKKALTLDESFPLVDYKGGKRLTISSAKREIEEIQDKFSEEKVKILKDLF